MFRRFVMLMLMCAAATTANAQQRPLLTDDVDITPPGSCVADINGDGVVDSRDVLAFLNAWSQGDSEADWNGDGVVNTQDLLAFLNDWTAC